MNDKKIYILLPVHNRKKITERFIIGLLGQTWDNYHLILIDDGSVDGTGEMVKGYLPDATVIKGTGNWWWAGCLQQGINWLQKHNVNRDDIVLIINDDVVIKSKFLSNGIAFLENKKKTLLLAQSIDETTMEPVESGVVADLKMHRFTVAKKGEVINCLSTRGLLLRFSDIIEIGGFYPKILPHYGSDYEYTIRAYKKGFQLRTIPSFHLEIDHDETGMHFLPDSDVLGAIRNVFSKRYVPNPIYRSTFIILISPKKRLTRLIYPFWKRAFCIVFHKIKNSVLVFLSKLKKKILSNYFNI